MAHPHPVAVFPTPRRRVHLLREAAAAGSRALVRTVVRRLRAHGGHPAPHGVQPLQQLAPAVWRAMSDLEF
jgi:hypothetical protein